MKKFKLSISHKELDVTTKKPATMSTTVIAENEESIKDDVFLSQMLSSGWYIRKIISVEEV